MPTNANWYNLQETRRYPVDETATGDDDAGVSLNDGILVDLNLRFPESYGRWAFIGGVTVTANLVTVTFIGTHNPDDAAGFTPLAAVTLQQPVTPYRHYQVEALQPGVGGWVVFGNSVNEPGAFKFSLPSQSLLAPKTTRAYADLPVRSIGKQYLANALTGLVNVTGVGFVSVTHEDLTIGGELVEAMVLRLNPDFAGGVNPLELFKGPCGARPESGTCDRPGIIDINGVTPDCDGNINITFAGAALAMLDGCGGMVVDVDFGLDEACDVNSPYRTFRDLCLPFLSSQASFESLSSQSEGPDPTPSISSESVGCNSLPYLENFDVGAPNWLVKTGNWGFTPYDSPYESLSGPDAGAQAYTALSEGIQNVSVVPDCSGSSQNRKVTADLQLTGTGLQRNGGIVLNYRLVVGPPLRFEYYLAWLDYNSKKLAILRWTGFGFIQEFATTLSGVVLGDWYRMVVEVTPGPGPQTTINVKLRNMSNLAVPSVSITTAVSNYSPANGDFGLAALDAVTRFSFFELKEL